MTRARQRGVALLSALGLMALTLPVATYLHLQARTDGWIVRNARAHTQCLYTAEAGVAAALATLATGALPGPVEAGPDGVLGTTDDGRFPFPAGHQPAFPDSRYTYAVAVRRLTADRIELTSRAAGPHGAERTVRVVAGYDPPNAPRPLAQRELR